MSNPKKPANLENCVVCTLYPLLAFGYRTGATPVTGSCEHLNPVTLPRFTLSKLHVLSTVLLIALLGASSIMYMEIIAEDINRSILFELMAEACFCLDGLVLVAGYVRKASVRVLVMNGWIQLVKATRRPLLGHQTVKRLRQRGYVYCVVSFVLFIGSFYYIRFIDHFRLKWGAIRAAANIFCTFIHAMIATQLIVELGMIIEILDSWQGMIRKSLESRLGIKTQEVGDSSTNCDPLVDLMKMYNSFMHNIRYINSFMNPATVYWFIILLTTIVVNVFAVLVTWWTSAYSISTSVLQIRTYGFIIVVFNFTDCIQRIADFGEDILSFLFKYPISKLTNAEAAQVEILITTLHIQKPVLRASDIFTVGTRLLASISGTVVTYVLVALQFHASWAKK